MGRKEGICYSKVQQCLEALVDEALTENLFLKRKKKGFKNKAVKNECPRQYQMLTFKKQQIEGMRLPLAHGTERQVMHGKPLLPERHFREQTPCAQASASAEPRPRAACPPLLPPARSCALRSFPYPQGAKAPAQSVHIRGRQQTARAVTRWGRGLQTRANTAVDTRQPGCEVQTFSGRNSQLTQIFSRTKD